MEQRSTGSTEIRIAKALLALLVGMTAIRAAFLPVTPPEAAMYNRFVGPGLQEALLANWANAPVLYVLLARFSTSALHLTDLSFRLPSLLAAILYFLAVYRLARRFFADGWLILLSVAIAALNPLILDDFVMATGSGLALAFWIWAVQLTLDERFNWAGVCAALSCCASFSFILPSALLAFLVPRRRLLSEFGLRALITAFLVLVIPFNHAQIGPLRPARLLETEQPALFLVPLVAWAAVRFVQRFGRAATAVGVITGAGLFLFEFRPQRLAAWPEYTSARNAIKAVRKDATLKSVRIVASPGMDQVLNYYRARYALGFWSVVKTPPADYYLLFQQDEHLILEHHLQVIWRDGFLTVAH